ncbi:PREDICTED: eppin [Nipponia nippon]|uniref:eppin n=1 Tax=Nipponia nippon TaxID=128390 RepID=UPI000510BFA9|nr:PREDICTED: eppin [Nipponia nippon]
MELPPGCLFLLAALLPLATWSDPALRTAGREEPRMAKPGYCYHIPEVEDPLDEDCGACRRNASCSHCTGDAGCPGDTKCCPSKCGYTCQEPVLGQQCEEFIYGGCGGNRNNFETEGECFQACSHVGN